MNFLLSIELFFVFFPYLNFFDFSGDKNQNSSCAIVHGNYVNVNSDDTQLSYFPRTISQKYLSPLWSGNDKYLYYKIPKSKKILHLLLVYHFPELCHFLSSSPSERWTASGVYNLGGRSAGRSLATAFNIPHKHRAVINLCREAKTTYSDGESFPGTGNAL